MKQKAHFKKQTTLDSLAGMVQRGFGGMEEKFEDVQKRFGDIEERDNNFRVEVNERFDRLEKIIFHDHQERISRLEVEVLKLGSDFRALLGGK